MKHDGCTGCKYESYSSFSSQCAGCTQNATDKYVRATNADLIREMDIEELADWIERHDAITEKEGRLKYEEIVEWLQKEAGE